MARKPLTVESYERRLVDAVLALHVATISRKLGEPSPGSRYMEHLQNERFTATLGLLRHRAREGDALARRIARYHTTSAARGEGERDA